jgi:hypothetical protein
MAKSKLVICDHADKHCLKLKCPEAKPHKPHAVDNPGNLCTESAACYQLNGDIEVRCIPVKKESV